MDPATILAGIELLSLLAQARIKAQQIAAEQDAANKAAQQADMATLWAQALAIHNKIQAGTGGVA